MSRRTIEEKRSSELEDRLRVHLADWNSLPKNGIPIHAFESVSSTMEVAHTLAASGAPEGTLVWAQRQIQGRGRLGRVWASPEGGLYFSLILKPGRALTEIPQLSLVAGLAVAEVVRDVTGLSGVLRWPNDLLLQEKKVAGVLVEAKTSDGFPDADRSVLNTQRSTLYAILGIGINVTSDPLTLPDTATSLAAVNPGSLPVLKNEGRMDAFRNPQFLYRLTGELYRHFHAWYDIWSCQGFASIHEALRPWLGFLGQPVHIVTGASRFEGTVRGLDESGKLLVRLDSGILKVFGMGEVTLLR